MDDRLLQIFKMLAHKLAEFEKQLGQKVDLMALLDECDKIDSNLEGGDNYGQD